MNVDKRSNLYKQLINDFGFSDKYEALHKPSVTKNNTLDNPQLRYLQKGGNFDRVAKTPDEFKLGILAGKTVFPYGKAGPKHMTMNTPAGPVPYPVKYTGITNNEITDSGIAYPGEDFVVDGDTVIESKLYDNTYMKPNKSKYMMRGGKLYKMGGRLKRYQDGGTLGYKDPNIAALEADLANKPSNADMSAAVNSKAQFTGGKDNKPTATVEVDEREYDLINALGDMDLYLDLKDQGYKINDIQAMLDAGSLMPVNVSAESTPTRPSSGPVGRPQGMQSSVQDSDVLPAPEFTEEVLPGEPAPDPQVYARQALNRTGITQDATYTDMTGAEYDARERGNVTRREFEGGDREGVVSDYDVQTTDLGVLAPDEVYNDMGHLVDMKEEPELSTNKNSQITNNMNDKIYAQSNRTTPVGEQMIDFASPLGAVKRVEDDADWDNVPQADRDLANSILTNTRTHTPRFRNDINQLISQMDISGNSDSQIDRMLDQPNSQGLRNPDGSIKSVAEAYQQVYGLEPNEIKSLLGWERDNQLWSNSMEAMQTMRNSASGRYTMLNNIARDLETGSSEPAKKDKAIRELDAIETGARTAMQVPFNRDATGQPIQDGSRLRTPQETLSIIQNVNTNTGKNPNLYKAIDEFVNTGVINDEGASANQSFQNAASQLSQVISNDPLLSNANLENNPQGALQAKIEYLDKVMYPADVQYAQSQSALDQAHEQLQAGIITQADYDGVMQQAEADYNYAKAASRMLAYYDAAERIANPELNAQRIGQLETLAGQYAQSENIKDPKLARRLMLAYAQGDVGFYNAMYSQEAPAPGSRGKYNMFKETIPLFQSERYEAPDASGIIATRNTEAGAKVQTRDKISGDTQPGRPAQPSSPPPADNPFLSMFGVHKATPKASSPPKSGSRPSGSSQYRPGDTDAGRYNSSVSAPAPVTRTNAGRSYESNTSRMRGTKQSGPAAKSVKMGRVPNVPQRQEGGTVSPTKYTRGQVIKYRSGGTIKTGIVDYVDDITGKVKLRK